LPGDLLPLVLDGTTVASVAVVDLLPCLVATRDGSYNTPMSVPTSPGLRLRQAWQARPIAIPGVFNALVAKMAERLGFQAVYLSGGALSAAFGLPDVGLLTLNDFVDFARGITQATALPLLCDADTGFGEALNVERTVRLFESSGAAGIHLEDQVLPKRCGHLSGKGLVEAEAMAAKIRAAVAARKQADFVIMARTDARSVHGFEDAVRRARLYVAAGADAVFPEALESAEEFAAFARAVEVPLLANNTEFGRSPRLDVAAFGQLGYRMVLFPLTGFRSAMKAAQLTLAEVAAKGHQNDRLASMLTRTELYELLNYDGYEARDRTYFG
jgi:methylisocitrate lyase